MKETTKKIPDTLLETGDVRLYETSSLNFPIRKCEEYLLSDPHAILRRQKIFADILRCPELLGKYEKLSEMTSELSEYLAKTGDDRDSEIIIYSIIRTRSFTSLVELAANELAPLVRDGVISAESIVDYIGALAEIYESAEYKSAKSWVDGLNMTMENIRSVTLGVNLDAQLRVSEIGIASFNKNPYVGGGVLNTLFRDTSPGDEFTCMISLGVKETKRLLGRSIVAVNNELLGAMEQLVRGSLKKIRYDILSLFRKEMAACAKLDGELDFIISAARYMLSLRNEGCSLTFPKPSSETRITGLYNPNLMSKLDAEHLVANNVAMNDSERVFVITGPNSGGKTVYLNSVGLAQMFFQAGLPVPAVSAEMAPADAIAVFSVKSMDCVNNGRLADEVKRLKECLEIIDGNSLILLDETFSSTSAFEGVFLAQSLVKYLSDLGCRALYVTHLHDLAERIDEMNRDGKYNIRKLTAENANGKRTYKIVPYHGYDSEKSLARDIVIENGLGFLFGEDA